MFKNVKRVACAMSGGVDSSVSAYILQKKGFEVIGVYMNNWDSVEEGLSKCTSSKEKEDTKYVCDKLGIKLYTLDCVKIFWNEVFINLLNNYKDGKTVVPDVMCNKLIKFDKLHNFCKEKLDVEYVATGHYAQNSLGNFLEKIINGDSKEKAKLLRSIDPVKDQTFFLALLKEKQLRRSMFPVGNLVKDKVKMIANEIGLNRISKKKESMGICFVGKRKNFDEFLNNYIDKKVGNIINIENKKVISQHDGIHHYTIGKKVSLPPKIYQCPKGLFVCGIDNETNTVYVCRGSNHSSLYSNSFILDNVSFINDNVEDYSSAHCLIQRNQPPVKCQLTRIDNRLLNVDLDYHYKSVANGQVR
uniref:tRNA-5-taurinomethyluridine 2-sulfurtransferase n=1 Tax=Parastrongyloides trichosuri TaxID=131310 RepID=A0A0N4ZV97_PARTI